MQTKPLAILVTGGQGRLARALVRIDPRIDAPSHESMDCSSYESIRAYCEKKPIDILIHAGAVTNVVEGDPSEDFLRSNILGTANVVLWSKRHGIRLVYISSDYVYPAERGNYSEEAALYPVNAYAKSKLGGEMAVHLHADSLIIRTSFYSSMNLPRGCVDQWTSRMPLPEAAKTIYELAVDSKARGIVNVGHPVKRNLLEIIRQEGNPSAASALRHELKLPYLLPPDSTLDTSKCRRILNKEPGLTKPQKACRVCSSTRLKVYLNMGPTPLANSYLHEEELKNPEFQEELALQLCHSCGLSQLTKVVDPERMFKNYLYVSSTPVTFRRHCEEMARTMTRILASEPASLVLDIGSNDGCLLSHFRDVGMRIVGVEPAENLAQEANHSRIPTVCTYWSPAAAQDIVSRFGNPRLITSVNVLGHVDDVDQFAAGISQCLAWNGVWMVEVPYLLDFIEKNEFDTAYHEHLSYWSVHPLSVLMEKHGFQIFDIHYFSSLHGGTIRVLACRPGQFPVHNRVNDFLRRERAFGIKKWSPYQAFQARVTANKTRLLRLIEGICGEGKTIWAYGASAKGNTLMNFYGLRNDQVPVVIDDNPKKWDYYTPGSRMRVTGIDELKKASVDYLLLLAWNFKEEIAQRCQAVGYGNAFLTPIPQPRIFSGKNNARRKVLQG